MSVMKTLEGNHPFKLPGMNALSPFCRPGLAQHHQINIAVILVALIERTTVKKEDPAPEAAWNYIPPILSKNLASK
jgi:hypothetical protein